MNYEETVEWFRTAKYGLMMHFGLYSTLEGEYKGQKSGIYAEWIQSKLQIPISEMEEIAKEFDPFNLNADEIIKKAKELGFSYFVITTKHHEGFALFNSQVDDYNCYKMSKCHRDLVKEFADACHKYGVKLGFYYSQDLDWHERHGGGYTMTNFNFPFWAGSTFDNSWDFSRDGKNYDICFRKKILPQVKELCTNYGEISTFWFDTPATISIEQSKELHDLVKSLQPQCLISSRIGNGYHDYIAFEDNEIPSRIEDTDAYKVFVEQGHCVNNGLYESACTLNDTWGFSKNDHNWKNPKVIQETKNKLNKIGVNYLINVGPDHTGKIPEISWELLKQIR